MSQVKAMKRRRVLDFAAYVAVALLIVLLITALALSNVPEGTSKGVINGCISGIAVFVTLLQQFRRARRRFAFWAIVVPAVIAHLVCFAFLGAVRPVWFMLIVPAEFALLAQLFGAFGVVKTGRQSPEI